MYIYIYVFKYIYIYIYIFVGRLSGAHIFKGTKHGLAGVGGVLVTTLNLNTNNDEIFKKYNLFFQPFFIF